ncbi:hypothetical protein E8E13_004762 [Curvularia kusanoi]|uniref:Chromo domain-containing protein n=1 Tax=Curvularia kusanoi TaxID=90978 RepID=A0A9P4TAH8_CURKU|nr:hypothetical protein E8E13_004762 [Curvularia kusanoi]
MPPALSDVESSDHEEVPASKPIKKPGKKAAEPVEPEESEEEDDVGEDEYVVEKIIGHRFNKGVLEFDVKWQGYENPKDRTWESEENLETAADVLKEYYEDIGGRPEKPEKGTKRKGRASTVKSETGTPASSSKRTKTKEEPAEKPWSPPPGSWEHDVSHIDTVEQSVDPKTGKEAKYAYLVWNNGRKSQHPLRHVYTKCPQKMLQYYESHLVFTTPPTNGDAMDEEL